MKKVIVGFLVFFLMAGTAYAAVNGMYKGRQIVSVLVDGKKVISAVPGQIIDGSTMLPLRAIADSLGANVAWDQSKYQASVTMPQQSAEPVQSGLSLEQLNKIGESIGLITALDATGQPIRSGSGFILDGMFITDHHVVEGSSSLKIVFGMKETIVQSNYVFDNAEKDLAAVKYDGVSLKLNLDKMEKGQLIYELGYPLKKFQIFDGIFEFYSAANTLVITAKSDHGDSGGIVINASGEVVGIMVGINEGIDGGHATPAQSLQEELNKL